MQPHFTTELRIVKIVKRQRDNTSPTSDDKDPQPKLVNYSDTESSDDEDDIRPPPRKRRAMTMYSDDKDDEDLTSYFTIKAVNEKKSSSRERISTQHQDFP